MTPVKECLQDDQKVDCCLGKALAMIEERKHILEFSLHEKDEY
jgi:hypothetical protein